MALFKKFWVLWMIERIYFSFSKVFTIFVTHMAAIACLFILCAHLVLLLLGILTWLVFTILVGYGFTPAESGIMLCAGILVLLAFITFLLKRAYGDMKDSLEDELYKTPSIPDVVGRITESFINGLQAEGSISAKRRK